MWQWIVGLGFLLSAPAGAVVPFYIECSTAPICERAGRTPCAQGLFSALVVYDGENSGQGYIERYETDGLVRLPDDLVNQAVSVSIEEGPEKTVIEIGPYSLQIRGVFLGLLDQSSFALEALLEDLNKETPASYACQILTLSQ